MELTKEQVQQVENFIILKQVNYIDLKLEILDHMVSEIEEKTNQKISFNDAFEVVAKKWNKHFTQRTSFYFGRFYPAPKIVIETAKKIYKPYYFIMFSLYIIPLFLLNHYQILVDANTQYHLTIFFKTTGALSLFLLVYSYYKSKKIKQKSIYSFILRTPFPSIFIGMIVLFTTYFSNDNTITSISAAIWCVFIFDSCASYFFYKKHELIIKKNTYETN